MLIEILLFGLLLVIAVVIMRLENLFAAAMLFSIFSLLSAGLFTLFDAVDVAFTEAAVGAGISTVLILGTLALTSEREYQSGFKPLPVVVVLATGAALLYGTADMPNYGDPQAPIHQHVAPEYVEGTKTKVGMPNIVTAVLASYRGYDTYGETMVVFTAGLGVLLLLGGPRREPDAEPAPEGDA
jgi:multicomponent Na+:H+ antiporter subunit B